MGRPRRRQVSRSERIRSTQRSPLPLYVPCMILRQRTANRSARYGRQGHLVATRITRWLEDFEGKHAPLHHQDRS
jgi:hypothetical protein